MSARLSILGAYSAGGHQPYPLLSVWVKGDIFCQMLLVLPRKKLRWLPLWIPFNKEWDDSFDAQKHIIEQVKKRCADMFGEVTCDFEEANRPRGEEVKG